MTEQEYYDGWPRALAAAAQTMRDSGVADDEQLAALCATFVVELAPALMRHMVPTPDDGARLLSDLLGRSAATAIRQKGQCQRHIVVPTNGRFRG